MTQSNDFEDEDVYRNGNCAFSIETLGLQVATDNTNAPFNKPDLHSTVSSFPLQGRYAHELDHLFRCVSTSWGFTCHLLLGRIFNYYVRLMSEFDLEKELAGRRLSEAVSDVRRKASRSNGVVAQNQFSIGLYSLTRENEVRRLLMGFPPVGPVDEIAPTLSRLWGVQEASIGMEDYFYRLPFEGVAGRAISAGSVLESLAVLKEAVIAVDNNEAKDTEVFNTTEKASPDYTIALSLGRELLSDLFDWDYQPIELEAALNLALWIPVKPSGVTNTDLLGWRDIEVGYRYLRIIKWMRKRATRLTAHDHLDADSRDRLFRDFFDDASRGLGWPTPFELAADWAEHLSGSSPWSQSQFCWWCLGKKRLRTNFGLHLLTEFQTSPYMCWFASSKANPLLRPSFTFVQYSNTCEIPEQHCDENESTISARLESYIFLGMLFVLGLRKPTAEEKFIINEHFELMARFIDSPLGRETAVRNFQMLKEQLALPPS